MVLAIGGCAIQGRCRVLGQRVTLAMRTRGREICNIDGSQVSARVVLYLRMISRDRMCQDGFASLVVEISGLGPPKVVHFVDERALV